MNFVWVDAENETLTTEVFHLKIMKFTLAIKFVHVINLTAVEAIYGMIGATKLLKGGMGLKFAIEGGESVDKRVLLTHRMRSPNN